jgi:large conductance mechanosensitive channel
MPLQGFRAFLEKHQALGLAIGVIIGTAVGKVVASLVADILMPLISPLIPGGEWRTARIILSRTVGADGKEVINAIHYGNFFGTVVDFLIIALCVYLITKAFLTEAPAPSPAPTKECPECTERIPAAAKRCKFCTAAAA